MIHNVGYVNSVDVWFRPLRRISSLSRLCFWWSLLWAHAHGELMSKVRWYYLYGLFLNRASFKGLWRSTLDYLIKKNLFLEGSLTRLWQSLELYTHGFCFVSAVKWIFLFPHNVLEWLKCSICYDLMYCSGIFSFVAVLGFLIGCCLNIFYFYADR